MCKTNTQSYQHEHTGININKFSPHSTGSASNDKAKTYVALKSILKQGCACVGGGGGGGGGATGRSQGFMTNQFSKKNSIVFVY